jgi:hypothetical protein
MTMYHRELTIYRFLTNYEQQVLADITEEQFKTPAFPGSNPPSWIVGHLAIAADFALMLLGKPTLCPKTWMVMFGPGSDPLKHLDKHPSKSELVAALDAGHAAVLSALPEANVEELKKPSPFQPLIKHLPTAGELLAHLLTSHESGHLSQLSACRRAGGHNPLF